MCGLMDGWMHRRAADGWMDGLIPYAITSRMWEEIGVPYPH